MREVDSVAESLWHRIAVRSPSVRRQLESASSGAIQLAGEQVGNEPSAIEMVYAIFANVLEFDENGQVLNAQYAQKRATDYLREYCDPNFIVDPPYEDWETELHEPPPLNDLM